MDFFLPKITSEGDKKKRRLQRPCSRIQELSSGRTYVGRASGAERKTQSPSGFAFPAPLSSPLPSAAKPKPCLVLLLPPPRHNRASTPPPPPPSTSASFPIPFRFRPRTLTLIPSPPTPRHRPGRRPHRAFGAIFGPCVLPPRLPSSRGEPGR